MEHESLLLKHRVDTLQPSDLATFMAENKMDYEEVSKGEKDARREKLVGLCAVTEQNFYHDSTKYYKVSS